MSAMRRLLLVAVVAGSAGPSGAAVAPGVPVPAGPPERGYVADALCARCHPDLYRSYQEVGMSHSFADAAAAPVIEEYGEASRFFHEPSGRTYEMDRRPDGRPVFHRWQVDAEGREVNAIELPVDWILGSGHTSRTYLFRTPGGELYQLPISWYTQEHRWAMAPGYDQRDHMGVSRRVQRECMFCHNAYPPEVPPGSDVRRQPHLFPERLAEGTGCQRCHGPGGHHVDVAVMGASPQTLRSTIFNPGRLTGKRRHEVCYQCHLQPSIAFMPVRRFDRGDYSYTPDQPIADYIVYLDPLEEHQGRGERFEINHHPYRLEQSRCFKESDGALGCTTCHDPHRKVPPAERAAHYRQACLGCHELAACDLRQMVAAGTADPAWAAIDPLDCVACHMPRHRTQDVVHVVMTDHLIRRRPGGPELTAPRPERQPVLIDLAFWDPERAPGGAEGEVYKAVGTLQAGGGSDALDHLERSLTASGLEEIAPWIDLARGQLMQRRFAQADVDLAGLLGRQPDNPLLTEWRGLARLGLDDRQVGLRLLRRAVELDPRAPESLFNLGRQLTLDGDAEAAIRLLRRAVELRPVMAAGWRALGQALAAHDEPAAAIEALQRALAVDPANTAAYYELARLLVTGGDPAEAERWLRHGAKWADDPAPLEELLAAATGAAAEETDAGAAAHHGRNSG